MTGFRRLGSGFAGQRRVLSLVLASSLVVAGLVTVPVQAVASPTAPVPAVSPSQFPAQVVPASPYESFVEASYHDFMSRLPIEYELSTYSSWLQTGKQSVANYLTSLSTSHEWVSTIVTKMYQDTLNRAPDQAGLSGWVYALQTKQHTVAEVASYFYASDEYYKDHAGNTDASWVTLLYQKLLNRDPDPLGLAYWVAQTNNPQYGRSWVAYNFYQSDESRARRVDALYQTLLARGPDPVGLAFWKVQVLSTGDLVLATQIAGSREYWDKAAVRFPTVPEPPSIQTSSLPDGELGTPYSTAVVATGGKLPFTWTAVGLPSGLSMDPGAGVISGTPSSWLAKAQVYIGLTDANFASTSSTVLLTVHADPVIDTTSLVFAVVGSGYSVALSTSSGSTPPYAWSASGLPSGLGLDPATGVLSGTPTTPGSYPIAVTLTDGRAKTVQKVLTLAVRLNEVVKQVSVGGVHTCALTSAGAARCWGRDYDGQLGDGAYDGGITPRDVTGLTSGVIAISAGDRHTCAITSAGGVKCWGDNGFGQLGNGSSRGSATPVDVVGLTSGVVAISAGGNLSCALTSVGGVMCWGLALGSGGLGDGLSHGSRKPVLVAGLSSGVSAIAVGAWHACALTTGGAVKCWGENFSGQLGDGTTANRLTPVDVSGLSSGVLAISAGASDTCAVLSGGGVTCWGANAYGQLGDGTTVNRSTPVAVVGLPSGATSVANGERSTCAVAGGAATCWGDNEWGQLGDGTTTGRPAPATVVGLSSGVTAVAANTTHTCAVTSKGGVKCWGDNTNGDLGNGSSYGVSLVPVDVYGFALG